MEKNMTDECKYIIKTDILTVEEADFILGLFTDYNTKYREIALFSNVDKDQRNWIMGHLEYVKSIRNKINVLLVNGAGEEIDD
jgi:hypothetical protein